MGTSPNSLGGMASPDHTEQLVSAEQVHTQLRSLPGIEHNVVEVLRTLARLESQLQDQEKRYQRRISELSSELSQLREDLADTRLCQNLDIGNVTCASCKSNSSAIADQEREQETTSQRQRRNRKKRSTGTESRSQSAVPVESSRPIDPEMDLTSSVRSDVDSSNNKPSNSRTDGTPGPSSELTPPRVDRLPKFEEMSEDSDATWRLITSTKPTAKKRVLFVGNLMHAITADQLKEFIAARAAEADHNVQVFDVKIFQKEKSSTAHIVASAADESFLSNRRFWPRPVYTREWNFDKYPQSDASGDQQTAQSSTTTTNSSSSRTDDSKSGHGVDCDILDDTCGAPARTPGQKSRGYQRDSPPETQAAKFSVTVGNAFASLSQDVDNISVQ